MKRCPQCLFLYPESDERCDFDQTPLQSVDDAEVDAATNPSRPRSRRSKALPIAVTVALVLGVLIFAIYYGFSRHAPKTSAAPQTSHTVAPVTTPEIVVTLASPSPVVSPSPSPYPSPAASPKTSSTVVTTTRTRATNDPISTSGPGPERGARPVITLTSGARIEADEVWRTKDGVWYRRNGLVTLLKRNQIKSIATR